MDVQVGQVEQLLKIPFIEFPNKIPMQVQVQEY